MLIVKNYGVLNVERSFMKMIVILKMTRRLLRNCRKKAIKHAHNVNIKSRKRKDAIISHVYVDINGVLHVEVLSLNVIVYLNNFETNLMMISLIHHSHFSFQDHLYYSHKSEVK